MEDIPQIVSTCSFSHRKETREAATQVNLLPVVFFLFYICPKIEVRLEIYSKQEPGIPTEVFVGLTQ